MLIRIHLKTFIFLLPLNNLLKYITLTRKIKTNTTNPGVVL